MSPDSDALAQAELRAATTQGEADAAMEALLARLPPDLIVPVSDALTLALRAQAAKIELLIQRLAHTAD